MVNVGKGRSAPRRVAIVVALTTLSVAAAAGLGGAPTFAAGPGEAPAFAAGPGEAPAFAAETLDDTPRRSAEFNGAVLAAAFQGNTIYVGGSFTAAYHDGRWHTRQRLAAIDANTGALLDWKPAADGAVRGLAVDGDLVYAVGDFGYVDGRHRDSLVALSAGNGAVGSLKHNVSGAPLAVGAGNGRLYVAGRITAVDGRPRANTAAFSLATGALDASWAPRTDDVVETLAVTADRIYLGGRFHRTNDVSSTGRLVAVSAADGALDLAFRPQPTAVVHGVAVAGSGVYAALGGDGGRAVAYGFDGRPRWTVTTDGDVQAVAVLGAVVYLGGHYDNVCQSTRTGAHGVCVDGSVPRVKLAGVDLNGALLPWAPQANGVHGVRALAVSSALGALAVGGEFTAIQGAPQRRLALFFP